MKLYVWMVLLWACSACNMFEVRSTDADSAANVDSALRADTAIAATVATPNLQDTFIQDGTHNKDTVLLPPTQIINTGSVQPGDVVRFAETLKGTPYLYASTDPAKGFDCSGFITYVFNHFNITVPRSSVDFTDVGKPVEERDARPGDLILFTGTDSTETKVGHMGLISTNDSNGLQFIHSTSGKAYGVTVTQLNDYYRSRFVKIIRIFPQNDAG